MFFIVRNLICIEFIAGEDLDDLYALLDNAFLDEDVDFEKDLAGLVIEESHEENLCFDECSKVFKTQRDFTKHNNAKHSSSRSGSGVSFSSEEIIQKKLHPDVLLTIVSITYVYHKRVETFFEKRLRV